MFLTQKYNFIHAVLLKKKYDKIMIKELEENTIESLFQIVKRK